MPHSFALAAFAAAFAIGSGAQAAAQAPARVQAPARAQTSAQARPAAPAAATAKPSWRERTFCGGGIGLGFGDVDFVSIEPLCGVRLHPRVAVGGGLLYRWSEDNRYDPDLSTTDYGGRAFVQYYPIPDLFLQAEYELINYEYPTSFESTDRETASSIFAGGGISRSAGGRAGFFASALYNFSYDDDEVPSPYDSPWVIRVGITAGF